MQMIDWSPDLTSDIRIGKDMRFLIKIHYMNYPKIQFGGNMNLATFWLLNNSVGRTFLLTRVKKDG